MALAPMRSCVAPGAPNPSCGGGRSGSCERRPRPAARQDPPAGPQATQPVDHRAGHRPNGGRSARGNDALDRWHDGPDGRHQRLFGAADLAGARAATAPGAPVQAVEGPGVRPQTAQDRRPLCQPAGPRHCALGRREVADTGARSHPARVTDEEGSRWYLDARLQAARHDYSVCRSQRARRQGDRPPACSVTAIRSSSVF